MTQNGLNKPASLTAALLARKGEAQPAMARQSEPHRRPHQADDGANNGETNGRGTAERNAQGDSPRSAGRANGTANTATLERVDGISTSTGGKRGRRPVGSGERVALTLRLDHERHTRLKLLGVHLNKSTQEMLESAVDELLGRHAAVTAGQCRCLLGGKTENECSA